METCGTLLATIPHEKTERSDTLERSHAVRMLLLIPSGYAPNSFWMTWGVVSAVCCCSAIMATICSPLTGTVSPM